MVPWGLPSILVGLGMLFAGNATPSNSMAYIRKHADWEVYRQDMENGMPFDEQQRKLKAGEYMQGIAQVDPRYGRIDDIESYERDVRKHGKDYAERLRRLGLYKRGD